MNLKINSRSKIKNEDGFVLVIALVMLLVLTMIGVSGIKNSTIELKIAGNERGAAVNFYAAEGACFEGARKVLDEDDTEVLLPAISEVTLDPTALIRESHDDESVETGDIKNLDTNNDGKIDYNDNFSISSFDGAMSNRLRNVATLNVIPSGSSLALGASRLYDYTVYGLSEDTSNGKAIIKVGTKKRF